MIALRACFTVAALVLAPVLFAPQLALSQPMEAEEAQGGFEPPGLAASAAVYRSALVAKRPPQPSAAAADAALKAADQALATKRFEVALAQLETAVAQGRETTATFLRLSGVWLALPKPDPNRAVQAAWLAYRAASSPPERQEALLRLGDLFETRLDQPREALAALRLLQAQGSKVAGLSERVEKLRLRVGLEWRGVRVEADAEQPRVCLQFSGPLKQGRTLHLDDYVKVEPAVPVTVDVAGRELCLGGLTHASRYRVSLREGLPSADGLTLRLGETREVAVGDRRPSAGFRGNAFILPRTGPDGVPIVTVNVDAVKLRAYRINDRNLVSQIGTRFLGSLASYDADQIAREQGELVWEGRMEVRSQRNASVVTAVPVRQLVGTPRPGVYVLTAQPADLPESELPEEQATQWLVLSDIGLTTLRGASGIDVFVRSLSSASPLPQATVALVARNNAELARATTDRDGRARFAADVAHGKGGNEPLLAVAYGADGDFAMLNLSRPALDLSDRGVGGRRAPGPLDAYLYADRGVYRPGERVNLTALLRDDRGDAVEGFPLTLRVLRPNGTVFRSGVVPAGDAGAYLLPLELTPSSPLGTWTVEALADPKASPIGTLRVQVEEFIPERLAVEAQGSAPVIDPSLPFELIVHSRFLYGPAAAGLGGSAEVSVGPDPEPFPAYRAFRFGLAQESLTPRTEALTFPTTGADGVSRVPVKLPTLPDTTRPLRAQFRVEVAEPGGRPSRQALAVPVRSQPIAIGLRSQFASDRVEEGGQAAFEVIVLDPDGKPVARPGLKAELFRERVRFLWYMEEGRYAYRTTLQSESLRRSALEITAERPAVQQVGPLDYGRYRLEVTDEATGVASSLRFSAGWQVALDAGDTPDKVEVTTDRPVYAAGDTARVRIVPPFPGEVQLTVATDRVLSVRQLSVPAEGATVDLVVGADWGAGAYALATLVRPPQADREHVPVRAIGVAWVGIDPSPRTLTVKLQAPETARPRQRVEVPVQVTTADGSPAADAWVTLAAVDEGILRLTEFASPDPARHYLGKRLLGLDILDDYGRLIDALSGPFGTLRQGGDQGGLGVSLPAVPLTIASLFQGPVKTDALGVARVALDLPDFNGELRLMAVAFNRARVGAVSAPLTVRSPLVAEMILPRFLAPGDTSRITLSLHNVEAEPGTYHLSLTGSGAVAVADVPASVDLARNARASLSATLQGVSAGIANVALAVDGPGGISVRRQLSLTVRPSRPVESALTLKRLAAGATTEATASLIAPYVPGTASVRLTYSSGAPFDVAGILAALERYPYGCLEQVVSRALPLLIAGDIEGAPDSQAISGETRDSRLDNAIGQVLDKQRFDGAFGVWSAYGEESAWLTAYAVELLVRARAAGRTVAEAPLVAGLEWLRRYAIDGGTEKEDLASRAYALHVLALAGVATPGPARYLHDTFLARLPTPLARGQLAAALARLGDSERARTAAAAATENLARDFWYADYGSTVRDAAALITVLGEVQLVGDRLPALLDRLPATELDVQRTNTQEQAWVVLGANALSAGKGPLTLRLQGVGARAGDPMLVRPAAAELAAGVRVTNAGAGEVWEATSVSGVPSQPQPAAREGLTVKRYFFTRDGRPLDLDRVHQNDLFVVVVQGEATTELTHQALLSHGLPAGWEIESVRLSGEGDQALAWLGEVTQPKAAEARDDRYVAAFDLTPEQPSFRVAYLVRAVTPGVYELPGAQVEDMYRPRFFARQAVNRVTVQPAP